MRDAIITDLKTFDANGDGNVMLIVFSYMQKLICIITLMKLALF